MIVEPQKPKRAFRRKPRGRPPLPGGRRQVNLQFTEALAAKLRERAQSRGVALAVIAREIMEAAL